MILDDFDSSIITRSCAQGTNLLVKVVVDLGVEIMDGFKSQSWIKLAAIY